MIKNWKIGSDIEIFLRDKVSKELKSAVGLVAGTKECPSWVYKEEDGYATETDNVSVEFLIPPSQTEDNFVKHISFMLNHINTIIPRELEIAIQPSGKFSDKELDSDQARLFGCDVDMNAWKGRHNKKPDTNTNYRSCGAHWHIGYDNPNPVDNIELVKAMDLFLGVPSILLDKDIFRKRLYGRCGSCRFKIYGVEYRVMSNHFISNEQLVRWVWRNTLTAINFVNNNPGYKYKDNLESIINNNNLKKATEVISKYNIDLPTTIKEYAS